MNRWQVEQLKAGKTKFTLGPYRIFDSIGKGGMGDVFKGEHTMLGRIEAVKVLPKHKTTPDSIVRFHREIRAQAQLDHPNLVRLTFAGQDGAAWFFVTEYVPGIDLRKLVRRRGKLSMTEAATIISQTAEGLAYAHERDLVHRDIKPGNILVTPDGRTKVIDLGLAAFLARRGRSQRAGRRAKSSARPIIWRPKPRPRRSVRSAISIRWAARSITPSPARLPFLAGRRWKSGAAR